MLFVFVLRIGFGLVAVKPGSPTQFVLYSRDGGTAKDPTLPIVWASLQNFRNCLPRDVNGMRLGLSDLRRQWCLRSRGAVVRHLEEAPTFVSGHLSLSAHSCGSEDASNKEKASDVALHRPQERTHKPRETP